MGELVLFRPRAKQARFVRRAGASAEILFFTGVRIVRGEVPQAPPPKTVSRGRAARTTRLRKSLDAAP